MLQREVCIGKIVRSESHVRYTCQVFGQGEVAGPPSPADYAFGRFVRIPLRAGPEGVVAVVAPDVLDVHAPSAPDVAGGYGARAATMPAGTWAIGLIYDTILVNPAYGTLGPRLSSDVQAELFSPDYISERAVLVSILVLGTMGGDTAGRGRPMHGVPELAPDLGATVLALDDDMLRTFHAFADGGQRGDQGASRPYLHMGYLPHAIAQDHALLPLAMLRTIERLEGLFPENSALLSIVKRNLAWRLKVQTAG